MLNWFARRLKEAQEKDKTGQGGFTLIELLVVVIIIGILAAIAIPTFLGQRARAQEASAVADMRNAVTAMETFGTGTSPAYNFITATVPLLEGIEPELTWVTGAAPAEGSVGFSGTTAATGGDRGVYTITAEAANGTTFVATAAPNGEVTYQKEGAPFAP